MIMGSGELFASHLRVYGGAIALEPRQQRRMAHAELLPDRLLRQTRLD